MSSRNNPTIRRRRLGAELKRLRDAAKVSMDDVAERIGGDKSKISRIENGRQGVHKLELEAMLELYGVHEERLRTALATLSRESRKKGWWQQYGDALGPDLQNHLSMEADVARIHAYQPLLIPGLLQTADYARSVHQSANKAASEDEIESFVSVRMARQEILQGESPTQYICTLDEAVLHRMIGGRKVLEGQLRRLLDVSNPPELSIQVIPFDQGWHAGLQGAFSIFSYPDPMDLDIVSVEYLDGSLFLEEDAAVGKYRLAVDQLRASALSSRHTRDLISRLLRDL